MKTLDVPTLDRPSHRGRAGIAVSVPVRQNLGAVDNRGSAGEILRN